MLFTLRMMIGSVRRFDEKLHRVIDAREWACEMREIRETRAEAVRRDQSHDTDLHCSCRYVDLDAARLRR